MGFCKISIMTNTKVTLRTTFLLIYLFSVNVNGAPAKTSESVTRANSTTNFSKVEESVDIIYNTNDLKEISRDGILKLQVIGNVSQVAVTCKYTGNVSEDSDAFVDWKYEGLLNKDEINLMETGNTAYINLSAGSPIARMLCTLQNKSLTSSSSNVTLIYTGDDKAPYLYNHGKTMNTNIFNKTVARLPCVLKYPIDNHGQEIKLQLLKDETEVDENYWSYFPEQGYILNFNKLGNPYGEYKCKVVNSTADDFVRIVFCSDDIVRAEVNVSKVNAGDHFYARDTSPTKFQCKVPESQFQNKFNWFYLYSNGTYEPIQHRERNTPSIQPYTDTVEINFPSADIIQVVCVGYLNDSNSTTYNNSVVVKVKEPTKPTFVASQPKGTVIYKDGINLTCHFEGVPLQFTWTKNGKVLAIGNHYIHHDYVNKRTTLTLNPPAYNEGESNYACTAYNFLSETSHTFKVKLPGPDTNEGSSTSPTLPILVGLLVVGTIIFVAVLTFFKVHLRRRFDPEQIRLFFNGTGSKERSNNDYSNDLDQQVPESIDSVPYDTDHEISRQSLHFIKELKRGNFGKVEMGQLTDKKTGKQTIVAIKSIINDTPGVTPKELDNEFVNFLKEIKASQFLGTHPNVVGYIGAVTVDLSQYSAYLVCEYCGGGDLRTLMSKGGTFYDEIRGERHEFPCTQRRNGTTGSMGGIVLRTSHLRRWAEEAASGMEYIHSKGLVHRDIALRNTLLAIHPDHNQNCDCLDPNILVAKISDFGLSKNLHELQKDYYQIVFHADPKQNRPHPLPLRWLAIESLETLKFTKESDCWTFGVALWELFTLGRIPYENEISGNDGGDLRLKLMSHLRHSENILPEPKFVHSKIWDIMRSCWNTSPDQRPNFQEIKQRLHEINLESNDANSVTDSNSEGHSALHYAVITPGHATSPPAIKGYSTISDVQNAAYDPEGDAESDGYSDDIEDSHGESDSAGVNESYEDDEGDRHGHEYLTVVTVSRITCDEDDVAEDRDSNYNSLVNVKS